MVALKNYINVAEWCKNLQVVFLFKKMRYEIDLSHLRLSTIFLRLQETQQTTCQSGINKNSYTDFGRELGSPNKPNCVVL